MARCPVCQKPLKNAVVRHHFLWPKKNQPHNWTIRVHRNCEQKYHAYFSNECQGRYDCYGCRYYNICCYRQKK